MLPSPPTRHEGHDMKRWMLALLFAPLAQAAEVYEAATFEGHRAGFVETKSSPVEGGKKVRAVSTMELTLRRFGATVKVRREEATTETPEGAILTTFMQQGQVGGKQLALAGVVNDGSLRVRTLGSDGERRSPWPEGVLGPMRQLGQFAARKPRPGEKFAFRRYEPTYNAVLTVRVEVKDWEMIDISGKPRRLLRVELVPDVLEAGATKVTPARATWWLDEDFAVARRRTTLEGLGELLLVRSDKAAATAAVAGGADVGKASLVPLDRVVPRPFDSREARYRIVPRGDAKTEGLFPADGHQTLKGDVLTVRPERGRGDDKAGEEHLGASLYIDRDDRITGLGKRITAGEADAWKKALRVERWVKNAMTNDSSAEMAPASTAARTLRGDCRHHAFLTAALCRAAGVPSRTAIGLVYVYRGGPAMGFHMWAEVLVDGAWRGVDSTLGRGGVSAAHVKVTDHSWAGTTSLTPLLPVQAVMGKVRLELIESR